MTEVGMLLPAMWHNTQWTQDESAGPLPESRPAWWQGMTSTGSNDSTAGLPVVDEYRGIASAKDDANGIQTANKAISSCLRVRVTY